MDYDSGLHEPRTNAVQSETGDDLRVSYESLRSPIANQGAHLYFIKIAKGRSPVKIGRANDPQVRLRTLQVASPYGLKLLGVLEDCGDYEIGFHAFLGCHRLRGEWFTWSKTVEDTVKLALSGGDWRAAISQRRQVGMDDEWWIGSPLYATEESDNVDT